MFVNRSGQNEQSLDRTFHRCFLPSFSSFGWEVSEEKIKMRKVNGRQTPSDGKSSHYLWHGELKTTLRCTEHIQDVSYVNIVTFFRTKLCLVPVTFFSWDYFFLWLFFPNQIVFLVPVTFLCDFFSLTKLCFLFLWLYFPLLYNTWQGDQSMIIQHIT